VFGSGKSYLLSVIVIFLTELFPLLEEQAAGHTSSSNYTPSLKLLVSSATNVAVDRVLMGYECYNYKFSYCVFLLTALLEYQFLITNLLFV